MSEENAGAQIPVEKVSDTAPDGADAGLSGAPRVARAVLKDYAGLTTLLGLGLYGLLRLAYAFFYLRLRTTPEEVGYGYSRVISESIVGALELVILVALLVASLITLYALAKIVGRRRIARSDRASLRKVLSESVLPTGRRIATVSLI